IAADRRADQVLEQRLGLADVEPKLLDRLLDRHHVRAPVRGDLVALGRDVADQPRDSPGDPAEREEGRLDLVTIQDLEHSAGADLDAQRLSLPAVRWMK